MQLHPRVTCATIDFAARFEGLRRRAARLPDGLGWTVGYGHSRTACAGAEVSEADARALLAWDLSQAAAVVEAVVFAPLDANQFDALCGFAFNIGEPAFRTCEVARHLNEGRPLRAAAALEMWRRATIGQDSLLVDAIVRRRAAEKALFLTPPDGFPPAPTPVLRPELDRRLTYDTDRLAASEEPTVTALAPLEGEDCTPVILAPQRSAVAAAADALSARLSRIAAPAPPPATAELELEDEPEPPPVSDPVEGGPVPQAAVDLRNGAQADGPAPHDARAALSPARRRGAAARRGGWLGAVEAGAVWAGIGLIGLTLFAVGAVCVFDRPTLGCALVATLGIVVMLPPAVHYLARADQARPRA